MKGVTQPVKPAPSLLLLIPAYNEEERIEPVLVEFAQYFAEHYTGKFQLVVVLNGCRDNTIGVVRRVAEKYPSVSALEFQAPIGKGGALIEGLKLAPLADLIGYVDADGATGPKAFSRTGAVVRQGGLRDRVAVVAGGGVAPEPDAAAAVHEPVFPCDRAVLAAAEHQGHAMSGEGDAAVGGGNDSIPPC